MRKRTTVLLCIALAVIAVGVTLYPLVSNLVSETSRSLVETRYTKAVEQMDDSEIRNAKAEAQGYNATLLTVTDKAFSKETLARAAESYDSLLNIRGDGIMGYVQIPMLNVELPIYHGTDESTLERGVGHLLGSSLPVGGIGTHCVLTGHSGLAGQRMFSDLNKLKIGDVFYLKILDETLAYMVLDINTVLPEDTSKLTVDPNRDSVTLVTCTPYGVNTHRLLVRGERIEYETAVSIVEDTPEEELPASTWKEEYLRGICFGCLGVAGVTTVFGLLWLRPKKPRYPMGKHSIYRNTAQPAAQSRRQSAEHRIRWDEVSAEDFGPPKKPTKRRRKRFRLFRRRKRGKHEKR